MWKMRQAMPENGRISGEISAILFLSVKETRDFGTM
jgi:hypothetical protein